MYTFIEIETNGQSNENTPSPEGPSAPPRKVSAHL